MINKKVQQLNSLYYELWSWIVFLIKSSWLIDKEVQKNLNWFEITLGPLWTLLTFPRTQFKTIQERKPTYKSEPNLSIYRDLSIRKIYLAVILNINKPQPRSSLCIIQVEACCLFVDHELITLNDINQKNHKYWNFIIYCKKESSLSFIFSFFLLFLKFSSYRMKI